MKIGDKITCISEGGLYVTGMIHHVTVQAVSPGSFNVANKDGALATLWRRAEGITWIRGWHEEDSDDVRALIAAFKLRAPPPMDLGDASKDYVEGKISLEAWRANLDRWDADFEEEMRAQR